MTTQDRIQKRKQRNLARRGRGPKLSPERIRQLVARYAVDAEDGPTTRELAAEFNISQSTVVQYLKRYSTEGTQS